MGSTLRPPDAAGLIATRGNADATSRAEWVLVALIVLAVLVVSLTGSPEP